jgi:hypothetical protein
MPKLQPLTDENDVELMMEFRTLYWHNWVNFCHSKGYNEKVDSEY